MKTSTSAIMGAVLLGWIASPAVAFSNAESLPHLGGVSVRCRGYRKAIRRATRAQRTRDHAVAPRAARYKKAKLRA